MYSTVGNKGSQNRLEAVWMFCFDWTRQSWKYIYVRMNWIIDIIVETHSCIYTKIK